ncbi:peptide deformylase, partial [bacterium]|nr:peptide deformylase [bacterium]
DEGCLSCPGLWGEVTRSAHVLAKGFNENGEPVEIESVGGVLSVVLQHETDHLDGILFLDRLDPSQQLRVMKEREEL